MGPPPPRTGPILIVESDRHLGNAIAEQLAADGYSVELAHTAEHARVLAGQRTPGLALLGAVESTGGAIRLLQEIRRPAGSESARWSAALPVVMFAPRAGEVDMLRAFEAGADDFLERSAGYLQLRARIGAILRRAEACPDLASVIEVRELRIDLCARSTSVDGRAVELRRLEFELLVHLAREPARVFSREDLLRAIWGYRSSSCTRTVESHASRLRRKLDSREPSRWVVNVWGVGYRLT